ncbi:acyl carrier protein [Lawsonibacter celer]|uniref:acyl carrier protein n=1 Tax=Lawsonibacter celer TaxID=2986526 RepID=UPI001647691E|nr:acyl carrier protein [Lawsonibacter celer]
MASVKDGVAEIISEILGIPQDTIVPESSITKDYGAKSHDIMQISANVQSRFGVKISYMQSRKAKTVADWFKLAGGE